MKLIDDKILAQVKRANTLLRTQNFSRAIAAYEKAINEHPYLINIFGFNLELAKSNLAAEKKAISGTKSPLTTTSLNDKKTPNKAISPYKLKRAQKPVLKLKTSLSIAVILHIYHDDIVEECLDSIDNIPFDFKLIVTTPLTHDNTAVIRLKSRFPDSEILHFENAGRDIGPFVKSWPLLKKYDICCKIHTKKGVSDYIEAWKHLCFEGILQSPHQVAGIIREFETDKSLALAGPELLYGSLEALVGHNKKQIHDLERDFNLTPTKNLKNGFFMGTMFWFRTKSYNFISKFSDLQFAAEAGQKDGMVEHALERVLGSYFLQNSKILLTRPNNKSQFSAKKVDTSYQSAVTTFHKHFDEVHESHVNIKDIVGHIHTGAEHERTVSGWMALKGNESPRQAIIRIDGTFDVDVQCDRFRADLQRNGINQGNHAFSLTIPFVFMDGQPHTFELVDKYSGKTVSTITKVKQRSSDIDVIRSYAEWDDEKEQRFLSTLSKHSTKIANTVTASIIMPTYNRADSIANAINSVLMQTFSNFELIIVDDGSTDHTGKLVKKCYKDPRLTYIPTNNQGVSNARNVGLENASGDFIFFLDSDNSWKANFLETMIRYMTHYQLNSAFCGLRAYGENKKTLHYKGCDFSWPDCVQSNYVDLNAFGFNQNAFFETPKFNTSLKRLVDWDYILRIAQYHSISYAPFLGVDYYDGSNDRITNTVYKQGDELSSIIKKIQDQFSSFKRGVYDPDYAWERISKLKLSPSSKKSPSVTTMITTYNHEKHIAQAICSVLNQTGNFHHSIIISDDGSTDKTRSIIRQYAEKYPDRIIDLSSDLNVGISANMLRCFKATKTRYLAICEGDDFWTDPQKLSKQIDFLESNKQHSMVFSQILIKNENKDRFETLPRQENISSESLNGWDFINEPTMNLIGNFSCCLFRTSVVNAMPEIMFKTRLNEIAVAFHVDKFGKIGFIKSLMSVYRQHSSGVWTGSERIAQLRSGLTARKMARAVAGPEYLPAIDDIITNKYLVPLSELNSENPVSVSTPVPQ
ncbi:glycosyltransferase [Pseudomonas plecoglossicida]|uniref:glycosyltransferase n=1 Tax=Pseudomonas plecoglossicida TaxID=70775 RepID=UPI0009DD5870|nr:glycosyltransferase [Pseudomonas plecoglossicida]